MNKLRLDLLNYLYGYITENKKVKIEEISKNRTNHITIVLEDIKESKDASAVIRSCDCFGIQKLHIIENENKYKINPAVAMGSFKWVDLFSYKNNISSKISKNTLKSEINLLNVYDKIDKSENTKICYSNLKSQGYKIIAMSSKGDKTIEELDYQDKMAFVFGSEESGLSEYASLNSDIQAKVPAYGHTQSYNLSVSAAITIYNSIQKLHNSNVNFPLNETELIELKINWVKKILKRGDLLEEIFYQN